MKVRFEVTKVERHDRCSPTTGKDRIVVTMQSVYSTISLVMEQHEAKAYRLGRNVDVELTPAR